MGYFLDRALLPSMINYGNTHCNIDDLINKTINLLPQVSSFSAKSNLLDQSKSLSNNQIHDPWNKLTFPASNIPQLRIREAHGLTKYCLIMANLGLQNTVSGTTFSFSVKTEISVENGEKCAPQVHCDKTIHFHSMCDHSSWTHVYSKAESTSYNINAKLNPGLCSAKKKSWEDLHC